MLRTRIVVLLALAAVATAAIAAGCGSSSDDNAAATTESSGAAATTSSGSASGGYGNSASPSTAPSGGAAAAAGGPATVNTASGDLGTFLVGTDGRTVYLWEGDSGTTSKCTGACAGAWPPLTTTGAPQASGSAMASLLGTTKRADGAMQVTYNGHPLYYFVKDTGPGSTAGQEVDAFGAEWYAVAPSGKSVESGHDEG